MFLTRGATTLGYNVFATRLPIQKAPILWINNI